MRTLPLIVLIAAAGSLVGCAAARHIDQAEAAALTDRHGDAVRHYQAALRARPSLAQDPAFDAKFRRAQAESFAAQAAQFAEQRQWEQVITHLERATQADATFELPDRAMTHAKREASKQVYDRAIQQADDNRLSGAIDTLRLALDYDGDNLAAGEAMTRLIAERAERQRQAAALFNDMQPIIDARRWNVAAAELKQVLQLDPEHQAARHALQNAEQQMRRSREEQQRGEQLLTRKMLDESIDALEQSLSIWPDNAQATDLLRAARQRRHQADDRLAQATTAWRQRDYDSALLRALEAETIYPFHKPIQQRLGDIRRDGAAYHNERGDTLVDLGDLADAEVAFRHALDFLPQDSSAKRGMGRVDAAYGQVARRDGKFGTAMLRYRMAHEHDRQNDYDQQVAALRDAILMQHAIDLAVEAFDGNGRADSAMANNVAALVANRAPAFIRLSEPPHYAVQLVIDNVTVHENVADVQHRRHAYTQYRDVPNPRIDDLHRAIDDAEGELRRLEHRRHRQCAHCHGRGRVECVIDGRRGWESCGHCSGRGHIIVIDEHRIGRARHRIDDLRRDLAHEPHYIRQAYTAYWNYSVSRYVKTGVLRGRLLVRDAQGRTAAEQPIDERFAAEDSVIANANPSIGLHEDRLVLPDDGAIRGSLLDSAASDAAGSIVQIARQLRHDELMHAAQSASDPIEPQVAAILVLDADDASARLDALMP